MAIASRFDNQSQAFIRGYLERASEYRLDKKNCTPGKTIECGNVCRKPENCKKPDDKPTSKAKNTASLSNPGRRKAKEKSFKAQVEERVKAFNESLLNKESSLASSSEADVLDVKLGQILRIPQKSIKTKKSGMSPQQIDAIASEMKKRGKNVTPVMIKKTGEDKYEVVQNGQIIEAARKAKLDFVWTVVVDDDMARQIAIESGLS